MSRVGLLHVHSTYSYDGQHTLEEIALFARRRGYSFIAITEHSDTFDDDTMDRMVAECRRLSDPSFLVLPGIEFSCEGSLHLLGLGIECFTEIRDPFSVARFVRGQGGLAIVSHPSRYHYELPPGLETEIDGLEVWNASYDGRFVPNDRSIALWQSLRRRNRALRAFGGQDLHRITSHCHVTITLTCKELTHNGILRELTAGHFIVSNPYWKLRPRSFEGSHPAHFITWARRVYLRARSIRDSLAEHMFTRKQRQ